MTLFHIVCTNFALLVSKTNITVPDASAKASKVFKTKSAKKGGKPSEKMSMPSALYPAKDSAKPEKPAKESSSTMDAKAAKMSESDDASAEQLPASMTDTKSAKMSSEYLVGVSSIGFVYLVLLLLRAPMLTSLPVIQLKLTL